MPAFTPPLPIRPPQAPKNFSCATAPKCTLSPLPLDPLQGFEAFCTRTQQSLQSLTAEADGLGTFSVPNAYPSTAVQPTLCEGRRFRASINVFRSPPYNAQSAGLALKLTPHDPLLPALRADVHYFETACSWWFSGACDLSAGPAGGLSGYSERFLKVWEGLRRRYRTDSNRQKQFLDVCYAGSVDRENAFGFVGEVVEGLLPAYLPLLLENFVPGGMKEAEQEECESFGIVGGAACESSTLRSPPFVSWSFSLAPSALTAAGRVYGTLRQGVYKRLYLTR